MKRNVFVHASNLRHIVEEYGTNDGEFRKIFPAPVRIKVRGKIITSATESMGVRNLFDS
jgi:hypothetical protein